MLNYIWLGLIIVGLVVAVSVDVHEQTTNKYRNGMELEAELQLERPFAEEITSPQDAMLIVASERFNTMYNESVGAEVVLQPAAATLLKDGTGTIILHINDQSPRIWKEMSNAAVTKDKLTGKIVSFTRAEDEKRMKVGIVFEPITFVRIKRVTKAAFDAASTAVTIAFGLIGIMALWLGIMRIADEAGAVKFLARLLRPAMKSLFPDVPSDHPAIGSMIMNISANMLGLSNAATPLGLKAMDELEKLNPRKGVATNAMCTFLAINTAGLTLIPATAIAVRAASGSGNPTIIVGTTIVGGLCSTTVGIISAKLLQRLPIFKRQIEAESTQSEPAEEAKQ